MIEAYLISLVYRPITASLQAAGREGKKVHGHYSDITSPHCQQCLKSSTNSASTGEIAQQVPKR